MHKKRQITRKHKVCYRQCAPKTSTHSATRQMMRTGEPLYSAVDVEHDTVIIITKQPVPSKLLLTYRTLYL